MFKTFNFGNDLIKNNNNPKLPTIKQTFTEKVFKYNGGTINPNIAKAQKTQTQVFWILFVSKNNLNIKTRPSNIKVNGINFPL